MGKNCDIISNNKEKYKNLFCIECDKLMLNEKLSRLFLGNNKILHDGCVTIPKRINEKEYYRIRCNDCFYNKFNRYPKKLNVIHYDLCYLMNVPKSEIEEHLKHKSNTLDNYIKKHGEKLGIQKFEDYKKRQSLTNTFEYKKEKYEWDDNTFKKYNLSRSVTLENLQKKHGKIKGMKKYADYCEKQSYVGCKLEYFQEKYGIEKGTLKYHEVNDKKKLNLNTFIRKYGVEKGTERFNSYTELLRKRNAKSIFYSKSSQKLFNDIYDKIEYKEVFYETLNKEYVFSSSTDNFYMTDFYVKDVNKVIEFYGDYFHCNPIKYEKEYYNQICKKKAKEIWEYDFKRINFLKNSYHLDVLIIWESEYKHNEKEVIERCLNFLKG